MENCVNDTPPAAAATPGQEEADMSLVSVIGQVVLPAVCGFGIVGNILNLAILTRRKLQKSFRTLEQSANLCLISLAVSDLMFCIFALLTMFLPADNTYQHRGLLLLYGVYNAAIINVFIMESTMLTVAMSLERYLAICFPLRQDIYLTTRRIKFVIVFTFMFSVAFNIPVLWRNEVVVLCVDWSNRVNKHENVTIGNSSWLLPNITLNGKEPHLGLADRITLPTITTWTPALLRTAGNASFNPNKLLSSTDKLSRVSPSSVSSSSHSTRHSLVTLPLSSPASVPAKPDVSFHKTPPTSAAVKRLYSTKTVPLAGNNVYDITYRLFWAFVGNFIPLLLLLYFNVCLFRKIYRSYKLRKQLGRQDRTKSSSHVLTMTLVAIVVLFFILVAPSEVTLQITHLTNNHNTPMAKTIETVLNLMQSINFSVNFILYCIISPHFRKTLKYMMLCGCYRFYQVSKNWRKEFETSLL